MYWAKRVEQWDPRFYFVDRGMYAIIYAIFYCVPKKTKI